MTNITEQVIGIGARNSTLRALIELVQALERRTPRPQINGERQIAIDAADLHARASDGIRAIRMELAREECADTATAQSVMTDDGGPSV